MPKHYRTPVNPGAMTPAEMVYRTLTAIGNAIMSAVIVFGFIALCTILFTITH